MTPRSPLAPALAALALVIACTSPPEATPEPAATTPAATTPAAKAPADPTPAAKAPTEPTPAITEPTPTPTADAPTPTPVGPLRVAAVREGPVRLLRQRDAPLVVLEGEPVPWIDGAFTRRPDAGAGLSTELSENDDAIHSLATVGGDDDPLGAWTTIVQEFMRTASIYEVYQRKDGAWRRKNLRKGVLVAYYAAYVERQGALLALQSWALDAKQDVYGEEDERPAASAFHTKVSRALARAQPSWVRIAGAELAAVPEIPAGLQLGGAVTTTDDGTILALASKPDADGDGGVVLMWPPGASVAERVEVPGLGDASNVTLGSSGEWATLGGRTDSTAGEESYLAVGRGREWERVTVSLPGRPAGATVDIAGAARAPDGELWIALGNPWQGGGDPQPVWRKPVEGPWQPVTLPTVGGDAFGPGTSRVHDMSDGRGWVEITRKSDPVPPEQAVGLVWAAGAMWVTLDAGDAYEGVAMAPSRTVVLTSRPGTAPATVLPPTWQILLERENHARRSAQPGGKGCDEFSIVIGPATLATTKPELAATIGGFTASGSAFDGDATFSAIYTAEHDGAEVLVAHAAAGTAELATALQGGVTKALDAAGVPSNAVAADCRISPPIQMVWEQSYP
jgi:hypothetical protein